MTRTWMTTVFAAVTMTAAAHGQGLKASVPFDFTAGGKQMASGTYAVYANKGIGASHSYILRNVANKQTVIAVSDRTASNDPVRSAKLVFRCVSAGCRLVEVHEPGKVSFGFPSIAPKNGEKEREVAIQMVPETGSKGF